MIQINRNRKKQEIDTVKIDTAGSTGYSKVKENSPAPVELGSEILVYLKIDNNKGYIQRMNKKTYKKEIKTKLIKDLKDLEEMYKKTENADHKNMIKMQIKNIENCKLCSLKTHLINNKIEYSENVICKIGDII